MKNNIIIDSYIEYLWMEDRLNYIQEELLTEAELNKLVLGVKSKLNFIESELKKYKIIPNEIKLLAKQEGKKIRSLFEQGKTPEEASKIIVNKSMKKLKGILMKAKSTFVSMSLSEKVGMSLLLFVAIVYINTILGVGLSILLDPAIAMKITLVIVAPTVEEIAKNYAIQLGMPWVATGVIFGLEMLSYVFILVNQGASIAKALIARLAVLIGHFATTFIQKKIIDTTKDEDDKNKKLFIAFLAGFTVHAIFNIVAIAMNDKALEWATS